MRRMVVAATIAGTVGSLTLAGVVAVSALAQGENGHGGPVGGPRLTNVPANAKAAGFSSPTVLSPELAEQAVAQGAVKLENPTADIPYYGYRGDGPMLPAPGDLPSSGHLVEASKTEPDKNTYLVLHGQHGADPNYDYGTHFLFQGHEAGKTGYLTRINLDADAAHRITLLATATTDGTPLPTFDGSTWDPWAQRLLFTAENGADGGVWQSTTGPNAQVEDISSALGRGSYEGIQNDSAGNLMVVEDIGGATVGGDKAKLPNSFVYRFVPADKGDLRHGKLQALQVVSHRTGQPIVFQPIDAAHPTGGAFTDDEKDLHTYGLSFTTRWVTLHDTATDASGKPFDANALAKAAKATPFKRPENGQFRPGTGFREFYFDETGDTNAASTANNGYGGWGSVLKLTQTDPRADTGTLSLVYNGDKEHTGLDNVTFVDADHVAFVEDAGDTLHTQRGLLDSGYLFDLEADYAHGAQPVRFLAEGRDSSATVDSALSVYSGFQNDGDNETTGIHMSDGDPTPQGILGAQVPTPFFGGWRLFWTQQHGDNVTWEVLAARR
ncbi:MAG TPA: alkaline phosphatase PhoX [Amycolatopsis sp.]|uniref:alkaline phosphatase PhoX n=1 Tax=Amycolatopsis sp. TaxID=37632 RepID=UPI002B47944F|nr:alkaline phosphatase PhoX [Amycolatopsis sp.]HKS44845.1 alkaline phosphatase PhoX [Amycolatopsis sp.]